MFDFQQKRRLKLVFESWITWTIILVLGIGVAIGAYDRYLIARDMADRRIELERELQAVERRRAELEAEVQYLTNERGIEAEMRRQFDIARPGEQVVIILDDTSEVVSEVVEEEVVERPWYRFW